MRGDQAETGVGATVAARGAAVTPLPRIWWIVGAVLAAVGIVAFGMQMANQSMAGSSEYPWGFYIALFYSAASAGAGLLVVAGIARWSDLLEGEQVSMLYAGSCALFVVASLLIVVDLGNPVAVMLTYASANPASPVFFDALVLPLCLVFSIVAALLARNKAAGRLLAVVGIVAGLALLGIEAWLLTTCSGRDAWGVLLGAGPALIQAVTLGVAAMVLLDPSRRGWRALLAGSALIMVASLVFDVALNQGSNTILGMQFAAIAASPLFWVATIVGVIAVIALCVNVAPVVARISALGVAVAVPLFKLAIFQATQSVVPLAQLEQPGSFPFSFIEVLVFVGIAGVGIIVYAAAMRVLSVRTAMTAGSVANNDEKEVQA